MGKFLETWTHTHSRTHTPISTGNQTFREQALWDKFTNRNHNKRKKNANTWPDNKKMGHSNANANVLSVNLACSQGTLRHLTKTPCPMCSPLRQQVFDRFPMTAVLNFHSVIPQRVTLEFRNRDSHCHWFSDWFVAWRVVPQGNLWFVGDKLFTNTTM